MDNLIAPHHDEDHEAGKSYQDLGDPDLLVQGVCVPRHVWISEVWISGIAKGCVLLSTPSGRFA